MPPKNQAIRAMAEHELGSPIYWSFTEVVRSDTREEVRDWDARWERMDALWARAINALDLTRAVSMASVRCVVEDHDHEYDRICGASLKHVLLTEDH